MIQWLTINITPPPLDEEIIVKGAYVGSESRVKIVTLDSSQASLEWHIDWLESENFTLWSDVK
jgi:hypothetical protein